MAAHRYWRLYITGNGGGAYVAINEIEMRVAADGSGSNQSITGNGTATGSSQYSGSYVPAYAFDANSSNRWDSGNGTYTAGAGTEWAKWDFGGGNEKDINHLTIKNTTQEPTNCHVLNAILQYSDDDASWTSWIGAFGHPATSGASASYVRSIYEVELTLPMPTASVLFGDRMELVLPMPTLEMEGGLSLANAFELTLPMPTLDMRTGQRVAAQLPMPTLVMTGTTTILIEIEGTLPMPTLTMRGTKTESIGVRASLPMPTLAIRGGARAQGELPMPTLSMSGKMGSVIRVQGELPMPTLDMSGTAQAFIIIEAIMPMMVPGPFGRIVAMMPMPQLTMEGRTVIAVTYEAYAVNLKPGGENPVHEVTRYTNWPFNQIVRYQGSYYGVADDGLYLIGGDTDYDPDAPLVPTAVPWNWHTHYTDFGSSQKKSVRELVIGGRLGPTVTAKVSVKEQADREYVYATQRSADAQNTRTKLGKGIKDRYWSFGLAGTGSGDVDSVDIDAVELGRKL